MQHLRGWFQAGFFLLFVLAPPLDIFRFDLTQNHFILFGMPWTLGLDAFINGEIGPAQAALNVVLRGFLPLLLIGGTLLWTAWRYGRLYCGWLCPHFSVVERINNFMRRASGKPSLWEAEPLPARQPDGSLLPRNPRYWLVTVLAAAGFALLWAVVLLTYLLPPAEIYHNLVNASLTPNQLRFIGIASLLLCIDFLFARHLFCRFGCAVGLFQSLAWMANPRAMVVGFDKRRASACQSCNNACDHACPMRLKPRTIKRRMFTCTECAQCISACDQVQQGKPGGGLLHWVEGERALPVTGERGSSAPAGEPARLG
ncbi:MAG: 4Fe-4S binding protein [Gammaproteobacteria bacterium]